MKISLKRLRYLLFGALGLVGLLGCQSGDPKDSLQEYPGPIATDMVKLQEQTAIPTSASQNPSVETATERPDSENIHLVNYQTSGELQEVRMSEVEGPIPVPKVEQAPMTLQAIQDLAIANNPTIRELSASAQAESDYQYQVGRSANPNVGYIANQLADQGTDQHLVFVERTFVTADKLQMNQDVVGHSVEAQRWDVESQRYRVLTDVRTKFVQALVAQRQMELTDSFHQVIQRGAELARRRFEAMESSQADLLQAEIQLNEVEVMRQQAEYRWKAAWQEMAAVAGVPDMSPTKLKGELSEAEDTLDWDAIYATLANESPELKAAYSRVSQARTNLSRQELQAIPNITGNLQAGVDNSTGSGLIQLQVGAPIPVFNTNEGNVSAAFNEYSRATHEVKRIEMSLKARLAQVSQEFNSSQVAVQRYEQAILPRAQQTLDLAERAYEAGEFSFIQTLIARRTYFDTNMNYLVSLGNLSQAQAKVDGLLLTGALDQPTTTSLGDSLRGQTFSQQ